MSAKDRNIQQQRAAYALKKVQAVVANQNEDVQKRFKAYSNSLPAMIQMNGIGQAMAFAYQKSNGSNKNEATGWTLLFGVVADWLLKERKLWGNAKPDLMRAITEGSQEEYQLAQVETQALLSWVKDFARAEISGEPEGD